MDETEDAPEVKVEYLLLSFEGAKALQAMVQAMGHTFENIPDYAAPVIVPFVMWSTVPGFNMAHITLNGGVEVLLQNTMILGQFSR